MKKYSTVFDLIIFLDLARVMLISINRNGNEYNPKTILHVSSSVRLKFFFLFLQWITVALSYNESLAMR